MGSFCGWSGTGLGSDMSQQAIKTMLAECRGPATAAPVSDFDDNGAIGIC